MNGDTETTELPKSVQDTISNEPTQTESKTTGDQSQTSETEYLPAEIRKKIEQVVESKGITDYTILIEAGSAVGDNFMGFIGKVTVAGVDENKKNTTLNWIVKTAPLNDIYRKMMKVELIYEREIFMYEHIFPTLANFQQEKSVLEPFNNYPKFVFSNLVPYQECFGMENVKNEGYVMRNRQEPLNYHHVKLIMKTYAKFHAVSLAMKDQKPEEFAALAVDMKDIVSAMQDKEDTYNAYRPMMEKAFNTLNPDTDQEVIKTYTKFYEKFLDVFNDTINITNRYSVFGHGDSWLNNMLWKYENPSDQTRPTNVCLLDFQLGRYGSPVCDLSYFLFTCTEKSLRDKHYDDAIKLYYYSLCAHLVELGSDPEKLFPFSALQDELKRFSVIGMFWTVLVLLVITRDSDEIPDMKAADITEDEVTSQFDKESKNQDIYRRRVRDVILDIYEKGYLDFLD